jgi:hypothetical protein
VVGKKRGGVFGDIRSTEGEAVEAKVGFTEGLKVGFRNG